MRRLRLDTPSARAALCAESAYRYAVAAPLEECSRARVLAFLLRGEGGAPPAFLQRDRMVALNAAHAQLRAELGRRLVVAGGAADAIVALQRDVGLPLAPATEGAAPLAPSVAAWCAGGCVGAAPLAADALADVVRARDALRALAQERAARKAALKLAVDECYSATARQRVVLVEVAARHAALAERTAALAPLADETLAELAREPAAVEAMVAAALDDARSAIGALRRRLALAALDAAVEDRLAAVAPESGSAGAPSSWSAFEGRCARLGAAARTEHWLRGLVELRERVERALDELRAAKRSMDRFEAEAQENRAAVLRSRERGATRLLAEQESFRKEQVKAWQARVRKLRMDAKQWEEAARIDLVVGEVRVLAWAKSESGKRKSIRANNLSTRAPVRAKVTDENVRSALPPLPPAPKAPAKSASEKSVKAASGKDFANGASGEAAAVARESSAAPLPPSAKAADGACATPPRSSAVPRSATPLAVPPSSPGFWG